jgi:tryptophan synthase alpha chain
LRREGRPGLVTYTTAGDPDLPRSGAILKALDRAGADVLEVGVPFSDPLADGPVIQRAAERALAAGGSLRAALSLIEEVRAEILAPIVIFSYANPLLRLGIQPFAARAAAAGVDGVLVLDLPIEEAGEFREVLASAGLDTIFLLSPTTTDARPSSDAAFFMPFRATASPAPAIGWRRAQRRSSAGFVPRPRCRWRWGLGFRARSTWPKSGRTQTRQWSAAPWCRSSPARAVRRGWSTRSKLTRDH